ncbi:unnamed protein product [Medioppia subpectinata]|uniref:Kazal-like domain-containing protein n=1 Tax=Medioppia subpectinata TaxID=1979941 RepID=A0A7R9KHZ6_9ACAR|nr:unnamed protein product [Medioppia subpectinata]CAG2103692.1 unnamed protein product [Medioppia subpectinata]
MYNVCPRVCVYWGQPLLFSSLNTGITDRRDPRWVGAWWIGFALMAVFIFIFALPLFMFPAKLKRPGTTSPDKNDRELVEKTQLMLDKKRKINENLSLSFRLWRLAKDPIFVCFVLGTTLRLFGVLGYMTFKPKYMESQYKKSASTANLFSGIIPAAIGLILGGAYIKYLQPGPKLLTSFITVIELLGLIGFISALFLGCPLTPFAALPVNNANVDVQTLCNQDCACSSNVFKPICGPDNYTNYFSPCFAGCKPDSSIINSINNKKQYSSCECMGGEGVATEGYCPTNCGNNFEIYVTIFGVVGTLARSGNGILSYRIVDEYDKSLASGIPNYIITAFIPYPLVYGAVTNTACEVWESKCGQTGNCLVYDSDKFRNRLHGLTIILYLLGSVFDVIIIFLSSRIKNLYDDEEEDNDDNNVDNDLNLDEIEFRQ